MTFDKVGSSLVKKFLETVYACREIEKIQVLFIYFFIIIIIIIIIIL